MNIGARPGPRRASALAGERPDEWKQKGVCGTRRMDPALFFPEHPRNAPERRRNRLRTKIAQAACGVCPVRQTCLDHALEVGETGVWGGTTDAKRGRIKAARARELKEAG